MNAEMGFEVAIGSEEEGLSWVGHVSPRRPCEDVVNHAQIKNFASLVQDASPWYWDVEAATARWGGILAPPGMLMVWSMPLPWQPDGSPPAPSMAMRIPLPGDTLINVATDTEFHRPAIVGDQLFMEEEITKVSSEKKTALGTGHFVITTMRYFNQRDELVGTHANTLFRFSPEGAATRPAAPAAATPAEPSDGERLPETVMPVTLRLCVHDAAATRDLFPGHHDPDYARGQNARNVYVNTMFLHGFVDRVGSEWAGPDAWLARRRLEMIAPICVDDVMRTDGRVVERWEEAGDAYAKVDLSVTTEHGVGARSLLVFRWSR
jgi:acyl dehydratase